MSIYVGLKRTLTEIQYESTQILTTALESAHDRNGLLQGTLMWYYDVKTIEFLVLLLIEINHLSCDIVISLEVTITYVIRNCTSKGGFRGKLHIFAEQTELFVPVLYF